MRSDPRWGPILIGLAAILWSTDALFRFPLAGRVDPLLIVLCEHLIAVLGLLPFIAAARWRELKELSALEWIACFFLGMGASAFATVLFTASFRYVNPSVAILLQKLQPVLVVIFAFLFLGERPKKNFFGWAPVALGAGVLLSFPTLDFSFISGGLDLHSRGVIFCLTAAAIWAISTVIGKRLLGKRSPSVVSFLRFAFGLLTLVVLLLLSGPKNPEGWGAVTDRSVAVSLLYMGLVPGLAAMLSYYAGLERTPASVATFVELIFPISAVVLNTAFLHTPLQPVQLASGALLLISVTFISMSATS